MRVIRRGLAGATAVMLAILPLFPVNPAGAAAVPKPRSDEWWFPAWDIENKVWPLTRGAGVTVAVIDSGVNASLPGLQNVVLPGTNLDSGNGDGRTDTDTELGGHGTAMAEFIAGQGQDNGVVGVAPDAKILPITAGINGITDGIKYATDHGAKVINISQAAVDLGIGGHLCPFDVEEAVAYAAKKDVVIVAGAGNDGDERNAPEWPADCPGVLAVGAVNGKKIPWTKTERQSYVSVAAPGIDMVSVGKNGNLRRSSGTSDATAVTSGAVALIRAKNPNLSAREVVQRIINTAIDAGPHGHDVYTGYGVVIPYRAMTTDVPKNAPNPPYQALDKYLASHKKPPLGQHATQPGKKSTAKKSSNSGLIAVIAIVAILIVAAVIVIAVLMRRRGGAQPVPPGQQPFSNPPYGNPPYGQYPPAPGPEGPYGAPQEPRPMAPPPQGPPPSFRPPTDPGGPTG